MIEDAPTGVASGKAAGSKVMAVLTSHSRDRMAETMPDYLVEDLTQYVLSLSICEATISSIRVFVNVEFPSPQSLEDSKFRYGIHKPC